MTEQLPSEQSGEMSRGLQFHLLRAISGNIYPDELEIVQRMLADEGFPSDIGAYTLKLTSETHGEEGQ